jgi:hypothetical protein
LEQIGIPRRLKNVIVDSYVNTQGRFYSNGSALDPINIVKGVKQGCPLSPLLFDMCVDPVITYLKDHKEDGYVADGMESSTIQAYADDMIVFSNSEQGLQKQINRGKKFFDFANIRLNPAKCEILAINGKKKDGGIYIDGVLKSYMGKEDFIKYLGVSLGSRRISKKKFIEAKFNKIYEELDKLEHSELAFNQMVKVIKGFIAKKLYYLFANMNIPKGMLERLDIRIRKVVNNFIKGQALQRSFIYANVRNGGLGALNMLNEYHAYKVNHIANMLSSEDGKKMLNGYISLKGKIIRI